MPLLIAGSYRCFRAAPLANVLQDAAQNSPSHCVGTATGKQSDQTNGDVWISSEARPRPGKYFPQAKLFGFSPS
jgi:hypothetical protein